MLPSTALEEAAAAGEGCGSVNDVDCDLLNCFSLAGCWGGLEDVCSRVAAAVDLSLGDSFCNSTIGCCLSAGAAMGLALIGGERDPEPGEVGEASLSGGGWSIKCNNINLT